MIEDTHITVDEIVERRKFRGVWPWFALNVILFPAPAYLTLLRVKEFSIAKNLGHLSVTLLLFLILFAAAGMQVIFPATGPLWMLLPVVSGIVLLVYSLSLKNDFAPFHLLEYIRARRLFIIGAVLLFTIISFLPSLELIELHQKPDSEFKTWMVALNFWQTVLIYVLALGVLFVGYVLNSAANVSIRRAFILYACFIMIVTQFFGILTLACTWLRLQGGFWMQAAGSLVVAVVAIDYWDANSLGQFVRRYFFLTCPKILSFLFFLLCFYGLPQQAVSLYAGHYYNKARPALVQVSFRHLIFNSTNHFDNAHKSHRHIRSLYTKAFINGSTEKLSALAGIVEQAKDTHIPNDADIAALTDLVKGRAGRPAAMDFDAIPFFRPVHKEWDVMLTALLRQKDISIAELDRVVAEVKKILPKTSRGMLPKIDVPHKTGYVALATGTQVAFVPPQFRYLSALLEKDFHPILSLRLAGSKYWAALLDINQESGMAWFRIQVPGNMQKAIQLLFDANEQAALKDEILSRLIVPVSLEYLEKAMSQNSAPIVVFSKNGLARSMPELFSGEGLTAVRRAVAGSAGYDGLQTPGITDRRENDSEEHEYADYLRSINQVKALLKPEASRHQHHLFFKPDDACDDITGLDRLRKIASIIENISPLRDTDRIDIAGLLIKHDHVNTAFDLFKKLLPEIGILSDLMPCNEAFLTGRQLFLLGDYEKAYSYLELAFLRHPFSTKYELWYHIVREKMGKASVRFLSPPWHQKDLYLYYQTLADLRDGRDQKALTRLEKVLEKDSHNSLAIHLLDRYFNRAINQRYYFPTQEGL